MLFVGYFQKAEIEIYFDWYIKVDENKSISSKRILIIYNVLQIDNFTQWSDIFPYKYFIDNKNPRILVCIGTENMRIIMIHPQCTDK